jgi:hypothetical protein
VPVLQHKLEKATCVLLRARTCEIVELHLANVIYSDQLPIARGLHHAANILHNKHPVPENRRRGNALVRQCQQVHAAQRFIHDQVICTIPAVDEGWKVISDHVKEGLWLTEYLCNTRHKQGHDEECRSALAHVGGARDAESYHTHTHTPDPPYWSDAIAASPSTCAWPVMTPCRGGATPEQREVFTTLVVNITLQTQSPAHNRANGADMLPWRTPPLSASA